MLPRKSALKKIFKKEKEALKYLYEKNVILPLAICLKDNYSLFKLNNLRFKCKNWQCRTGYSALRNTIFFHPRIKINNFLQIAYYWPAKCSFTSIKMITGHIRKSISRVIKIITKKNLLLY